jgi:hypothetical protein
VRSERVLNEGEYHEVLQQEFGIVM